MTMRYIIYARRSSEDKTDRQVLSIPAQIEEIQKKFPDLTIVKTFEESMSAFKHDNRRPFFREMIEMFREGKADGLLAWHPDRLSRGDYSAADIMSLLDQGLLKDLKFVTSHFDPSPEGKWVLRMALSQSRYSSDKLSVDVKRGMFKKCKLGHMPTKPPLGYMPDRMAEKGERRHLKDPDRFELVRKMWELMLTGQYGVMEIVRQANGWGLTTRPTKRNLARPLSKSTIYKTFCNPYYTGQFQWSHEIYEGKHPKMVTMEEFEQVQILLGRRHVPRPKIYESLTSGLVMCPCGASVVVDNTKKKIKLTGALKIFQYARCSRNKKGQQCTQPQIPLNELERQMDQFLGRIRITPAFHEWAIKNINRVRENEETFQAAQVDALRKAHDNCQKKLNNLLELRISPENMDGSLLSDEEFRNRRASLMQERDLHSERLKQADQSADKWADILAEAFDTALNAQQKFEEADTKERKLILSRIGANLILDQKKLDLQAKRKYIAFVKRAPEALELEVRGGMERIRFGNALKETQEALLECWSK